MYTNEVNLMREWLSGRALPCQGKCREFESRLPLQICRPAKVFFYTLLTERHLPYLWGPRKIN